MDEKTKEFKYVVLVLSHANSLKAVLFPEQYAIEGYVEEQNYNASLRIFFIDIVDLQDVESITYEELTKEDCLVMDSHKSMFDFKVELQRELERLGLKEKEDE